VIDSIFSDDKDKAFDFKCPTDISPGEDCVAKPDKIISVSKEDEWTSSYIADQLFIEMNETTRTVLLCKDTKKPQEANYYHVEAATYARRISAGDFSNPNTEKPVFKLNIVDFSPKLQTHLSESKKFGTLNDIIKEAVFKLFRARHKMIFYEHIEPKKFRWEFVK
jgi:hypothetical protein